MNQLEIYERLVELANQMKYLAELNDVEGDGQGRAASIAYRHAQVVIAKLASKVHEKGVEVDTTD